MGNRGRRGHGAAAEGQMEVGGIREGLWQKSRARNSSERSGIGSGISSREREGEERRDELEGEQILSWSWFWNGVGYGMDGISSLNSHLELRGLG